VSEELPKGLLEDSALGKQKDLVLTENIRLRAQNDLLKE
jgi:hypothetical protein